MLTWCAVPDCYAMVLVTAGAKAVRTCSAHAGQRPPVETDQERIARVRAVMGWAKARVR